MKALAPAKRGSSIDHLRTKGFVPRGLSPDAAALYVGIHPEAIENWCRSHKIPMRYIDDVQVVDRCDLDSVLGSVYVVGFADYVKIGWSANTRVRFIDIDGNIPEQLQIYAVIPGQTRAYERELLTRFRDLRSKGEWFYRRGAIAEWVELGCPV